MRAICIYNENHYQYEFIKTIMIICVCRRVSDREIARQARSGLSFDDIQFELGVATQCGRCEGCARDVVAQCSALYPVAALHGFMPMSSVAAGCQA